MQFLFIQGEKEESFYDVKSKLLSLASNSEDINGKDYKINYAEGNNYFEPDG